MSARRVRIGIDTGGTFTDVVAVDEQTGATTTTKTPSTPADPAEGFLTGVRKALDLLGIPEGEAGDAITAVSHGTTVATTSCSRASSTASASSPPRATSRSWRSPGSRYPTATATAISG